MISDSRAGVLQRDLDYLAMLLDRLDADSFGDRCAHQHCLFRDAKETTVEVVEIWIGDEERYYFHFEAFRGPPQGVA